MSEEFEPKVVAFCCTYCSYTAADLAGSLRIEYSPNVRIVKILCTGKVEPILLLEAFNQGADIVYVAGCAIGDCHFIEGNLWARRRVNYTRELLEEIGLEKERLRMVNVSASMARPLAEIIIDMVDTVRKLGPNPVKDSL